MQNAQIHIKRLTDGLPTPGDFELVECEMPRIRGGEMLMRAKWLSIDPLVQAFAGGRHPATGPQAGDIVPARAVAEVIESRHDLFSVGELLVLETGLQKFAVSDGIGAYRLHPGQNPPSTALGALGTPGMLAYFGLTEAAKLQPGETVLVSTAAGGVGSMAGQFARLKGARVIGIAHSKEQCDWAVRGARFAACIDQTAADISARLLALAPSGFDVYFENVGGELLGKLVEGGHLKPDARVVLCGRVAQYDLAGTRGSGLAPVMAPRAQISALIAGDYERRREQFLKEAIPWVKSNFVVWREDVVEGLQNAAAQLCKLMRGETIGKALVKL